MFSFEHKEYLSLLFLLPILIGLYLFDYFRKRRDLRKIGDPVLILQMMPDYSRLRQNLKFILLLLAVALLVFAIAGPRFGSRLQQVKHDGIDIIIALDVSNSMLAEDIKPNRLDRAKQELSRLLDKLGNNRIGLVVFAGEAYTQIPVTNDYLSAKMFLSGIHTEMISRQGTAIGEAIELAVRSFNFQSKAGKAIVIISDGENHEEGVEKACKEASEKGIRIFTIGMGSNQGVRIPVSDNPYNKDFRRDKDGNFVITRLNEDMLMKIAEEGKGKYYHAISPDLGLTRMLADLDKLNKEESAFTVYSEYEEQFPGLIWIVLLILVAEFLILERKNKWLRNIKVFEK